MKMHQPDQNKPSQDEALEAPAKLVSALRRLPQEPVFIPRTKDEAILRAARKQLGHPASSRMTWFRLMPWAAAAAAIVLLAAIPGLFMPPASRPLSESVFARGDLNRDGHVDILDAFTLARQLKQGGTRNLQFDLNGDGVVDERDVATLAARAVKLERGGRS